ncbi:MAG: 5 nucleotidase, deoxy (Pyrimidine), cytosolic type protein [Acidimicrobiaceae bacterium]|jgi:uncharacterized HAD superfamily protein
MASVDGVVIGLDLDGVLCDLGPGVSARIADRFGLATHPATWRSYDLRRLELGVPEDHFGAFLDEIFAEAALYAEAPPTRGAVAGVARLRAAGHGVVGITARPAHLAEVTARWLSATGLVLDAVHHTQVGAKAAVATQLGVDATVEDNPAEAELLAGVCTSFLLDHPYNRDVVLVRARRIQSWDDLVGRLCQLRLFA